MGEGINNLLPKFFLSVDPILYNSCTPQLHHSSHHIALTEKFTFSAYHIAHVISRCIQINQLHFYLDLKLFSLSQSLHKIPRMNDQHITKIYTASLSFTVAKLILSLSKFTLL